MILQTCKAIINFYSFDLQKFGKKEKNYDERFQTIKSDENLRKKKRKLEIVNMEYLIALPTFLLFQIPLAPRMFPVWDFVVGIFIQKSMLNMNWVLSTLSCQHLYSEKINILQTGIDLWILSYL